MPSTASRSSGQRRTKRDAPPVPRPGGRSERVRQAVLHAAAHELLHAGFENLSIARVAERAGVHHTTVYRRWPSRRRLMFEALAELTREGLPIPDTGSLRGDLHEYFATMIAVVGQPRVAALVRGLVSGGPHEELREYWHDRHARVADMTARAVKRRELTSDVDAWRLIELIAGPLWMRVLMTGLPLDEAFLERAIDDALRAVRAGA